MASASLIMMALGDFRFGIETAAYQELVRKYSWRWAKIDRLMTKPARQFIGPGDTSVEMRGTIYPSFSRRNDGLGQIPAMKAAADAGKPLSLVDGNGRVWGDYVIESLEETQSVFMSDGSPRKIEFSISLCEYGDYDGKTGAVQLSDNANGFTPGKIDIPSQLTDLDTADWS